MPKIPMIPMLKILSQYAYANKLALNCHNLDSIKNVFSHYNKTAKLLN